MKNDAGNAKLTADKTGCTLKDIRYLEDVTIFYVVNSNGDAVDADDSTDGEFKSYLCVNCDEFIETWRRVEDHIHVTT